MSRAVSAAPPPTAAPAARSGGPERAAGPPPGAGQAGFATLLHSARTAPAEGHTKQGHRRGANPADTFGVTTGDPTATPSPLTPAPLAAHLAAAPLGAAPLGATPLAPTDPAAAATAGAAVGLLGTALPAVAPSADVAGAIVAERPAPVGAAVAPTSGATAISNPGPAAPSGAGDPAPTPPASPVVAAPTTPVPAPVGGPSGSVPAAPGPAPAPSPSASTSPRSTAGSGASAPVGLDRLTELLAPTSPGTTHPDRDTRGDSDRAGTDRSRPDRLVAPSVRAAGAPVADAGPVDGLATGPAAGATGPSGPHPGTPVTAVPLAKLPAAVSATVTTLVHGGQSLARISLTPESLGGARIVLAHSAAGLSARVVVDHPEAAQALLGHVEELRRSLEANGTPVIRLEVTTSTGQDGASPRDGANPGAFAGTSTGTDGRGHHAPAEHPGALPGEPGRDGEAAASTQTLTVALGDGTLLNLLV